MSLKKITWTDYYSSEPRLPFDVVFSIVEEEVVTQEIPAHRYLLATCSPVFCKQFFGLLAEKNKNITIRGTTGHAFNFLVQHIYGFNLDYEMEVDQLFEILNLSEMYDVAVLKELITAKLSDIIVTKDEVLEAARVALAYHHFEKASNSVLLNCSRVLKKNQEDFATLQLPQEDQALVGHLMAIEDPLHIEEDELGSALHELFKVQSPSAGRVPTTPPNLSMVNWMDFVEPNSPIPPDVCFRIVERRNNNEGEGEGKVMGEVQAHKYYLAAVSDIFKSLFFGREVAPSSCQPEAVGNNDIYDSTPPAETKELRTFFPGHIELGDRLGDYSKAVTTRDYVISDEEGVENVNIACSSVDAFKVMIDYMYGKFPTLRGAEEICELFEIVDLAERFKVKDGKVHVALQPGFLSNPDVGIKICLNSRLHQNLPDLSGILMGFEKVRKKSNANLISDTPFLHIDVMGTFFVLRPVIGETLEVTVIKKGSGHLGALLHDVFSVSVCGNNLEKKDINLGDSVLVKVERVSNMGERPVLLANFLKTNSDSSLPHALEENDSGVDSERGEKRKTAGGVDEEEERRRQRKAAKKARKEKERLEASTRMAAPGGDDTVEDILGSVDSQRKTLDFQTSPEKRAGGRGGREIQQSDLPEGFIIHIPEGKTYKLYKGPDGKTYRSLNDIRKRYLGEEVGSSPIRKAPNTANATSPTKKEVKEPTKKEVKEHIQETLDSVSATWNIEEGTGDLADDHPKYLAFSEKQLAEMDPYSKNFWVEPEKKKKQVKAKPAQLEAEEQAVDEIVAEELQEEQVDETEKPDADNNIEEPETERKKSKKKKKLSLSEGDTSAHYTLPAVDQIDETHMSERKKKKKKKDKKKHSTSMDQGFL